MGNSPSVELQNEKLTWSGNHSLQVNEDLKERYVKILEDNFEIGEELQMRSGEVTIREVGVNYLHYFITTTATTPRWIIEFGRGGCLYDNTVVVQSNNNVDFGSTKIERKFELTHKVMERMKEVVGATGYSLALRNSEHVVRYIHSGAWVCCQMNSSEEGIGKWLLPHLMKDPMKLQMNRLPIELSTKSTTNREIVPGLRPIIEFRSAHASKSPIVVDDEAYNIVVIGPSGSGKSTFINRLFNRQVCNPLGSGTRIDFPAYTGTMESLDGTTMNVNVIESKGFCDSSLYPEEVYHFLKQYLKNDTAKIDKLVVLTSERILPLHAKSIQQILGWLNFHLAETKGCFLFICNKADCLDEADRVENVAAMASTLDTGNFYAEQEQERRLHWNVSLGIPPNASAQEVEESWDSIRIQLDKFEYYQGHPSRITVDPSTCVIL